MPHRWVSTAATVRLYLAPTVRQVGVSRSLHVSLDVPSNARAAAPVCRRAGALEVRYRAAAGVGEEAALVPMVETGHVTVLIVMAHTFAELRDGAVARQHEHGSQIPAHFRTHTL